MSVEAKIDKLTELVRDQSEEIEIREQGRPE